MTSADNLRAFKRDGRIVIVGASLAGLRAAEALRDEGFTGSLTMIGDELGEPYDRPPLSKQVLTGWVPADGTTLPRRRGIDAQWLLGVPASGLDLATNHVHLADGREVPFDRVLISTGVRARPWFVESEAALDGVFVVRTREHAESLQRALAAGPSRVLVIGAGFTGSEIASICRERDIPVTVAELAPAPLVGALGAMVGEVASDMQRAHGVDLRCGVKVTQLEGDAQGHFRRAHFSDGRTIDADVAVVALGSIRNTEWLRESGLAAGVWGITCDTGCRALDIHGRVADDVFAAGDVARCPNPIYEYRLIALEHWANAVEQAEVAAHNMVSAQADRWPHLSIPLFWSIQFGVNIKSVGVPTFADAVVVTQGSLDDHRFVTVYGYRGRVTAAVSFNNGKWLDHYRRLIETAAPFPPPCPTPDQPADMKPVPVDFPGPALLAQGATAVVTGHDPGERRVTAVHRHRQEEGRTTATGTPGTLQRIFDYSARADPYPLYAELRRTPVARQEDGSYVISAYREITDILNDPHLSSDVRNLSRPMPSVEGGATSSFIHMDSPEHDRLRRMATRHFGPPHTPGLVTGLEGILTATVRSLIDDLVGKEQIDVVDDFAFPFPVTVICHLLGVPRENEPRFHLWVNDIMNSIDYDPKTDPKEKLDKGVQARKDLRQCLGELVEQRHGRPGDDLLSRLANDDGPDGRMADADIVATAKLLLIAGHETIVNLITNGMLTLLRHPQVLQRLRDEPDLVVPLVEELLRYEPPVQIIPWRAAYSDITVADTVIPKGSQIMLMLASGSRDPKRFHDPDRFDPDRRDNQHLGFGSGIHLCFGGPLARRETQIALTELVHRLDRPRLVADPPPYRPSPVLRGPIHLDIEQGDG
ncbi:Cytochrome P450 [Streptomyces mirabilis]|uniref:Cytochrome P450 n=2 Tax=Streptomyces mirabilis TaxID=68239 RepID=A0A1I2SYC8_9ACTN|nr:Cytochrome P450 [Streptomyces mirabilis]